MIAAADFLRTLTLIGGGMVIGVGAPVMWERVNAWTGLGYSTRMARFVPVLLFSVHVLVIIFVTFTILPYYGESLSWRTPMAFSIFALKFLLMLAIRSATQEMEDQRWAERSTARAGGRREFDPPAE